MSEESHDTNGQLVSTVLNLAEKDTALGEDTEMIILAALESEQALTEALGEEPTPPQQPPQPPTRQNTDESDPEPAGAFLSAIEVTGFRGVGPTATLELTPGPGLTIVAGRNGSGKSSFAEALELALTGYSYRWKKKNSVVWQQNWRNIHDGASPAIRVRLAEEGAGATTVGVDWPKSAMLTECSTWTQRHGKSREAGTSSLGWGNALELHRPILSYDELGGLLEAGPSELHDALANLLGLEQLSDATQRLRAAVKRLREPEKTAKSLREALIPHLEACTDERAVEVRELLRKRKPDLNRIQELVTGTGTRSDGALTRLQELAHAWVPPQQEVDDAVGALRSTLAEELILLENSLLGEDHRTVLLRQALEFQHQHGETPCPVCGEGTLDDEWGKRVLAQLNEDEARLAAARQARDAVHHRARHLRELVARVPTPTAPRDIELSTLTRAQAAHARWMQPPDDNSALADHVAASYAELAEAVSALRDEAATALAEREDAWAPLAEQVATWLGHARTAHEQADTLARVKKAHTWLKGNSNDLRNQRLEPLAERAREIWAQLRQESNVDLGSITLEGSGPRRKVSLHADVDGEQTGALGVMSQGELHALALALFLPRATMPESPLRFVLLDDPVQAMDPTKVDGFVQVLSRIARDRQVIVFSHDDRLPEAARRTGAHARILEVTRGKGSVVTTTPGSDPAHHYIGDARALAKDPEVAPEVKARVLPGLCRMAVEAAARDVFLYRRYATGAAKVDTEDTWNATTRVKPRVSLALYDRADADLTKWCQAKPWRAPTLEVCSSGTHEELTRNPIGTVRDLDETVNDLLQGRR
ncbi:AAA family ATPase [Haloactinomyces albus]|uniref:Nuclease SbcCD subunit C n=1 Tax=Haloactinomyces albus TaxID=1352928 RepID=A0AAE3ZJV9_9ACTN|nr:AAA family ATPase [Haloactinomyces albus]MDR7304214.1 DNA repair exonuclease SbcCD ATPase subunit [Haloactinomyces albus]